jgi:hypothetical protein
VGAEGEAAARRGEPGVQVRFESFRIVRFELFRIVLNCFECFELFRIFLNCFELFELF